MHLRIASRRLRFVAIAALAALTLAATGADAGNGNGHGRGKKHKKYRKSSHAHRYEVCREPSYVVIARPARRIHAAPVYVERAPRYVSYRSQRAIVVRPAPYVRVGARVGAVNIGVVFGGGQRHSDYEYGCNFCDSRHSSFNAYDHHVRSCSYRPRHVEIRARPWDDAGYGEWEGRDPTDCRAPGGYDEGRRYDDRGDDDRGYDEGGYDEGYDDR